MAKSFFVSIICFFIFFGVSAQNKYNEVTLPELMEKLRGSENGIDGGEFADSLAKKGYKINWIDGGLQEWEWYMNNVETFRCMDYFVN